MKSKKKGFYIVLEGVAGCGKSTQIKLLNERVKKEFPKINIINIREPGGTEIAEDIRRIFQVKEYQEEMEPICEQYLVASARAQSLRKLVKPNLKKAKNIIISDRSFFSSIANQGFGRKLGYKAVMEINKWAIGDFWPDHVYTIDLPVSESFRRMKDQNGDKFEKLDKAFHERVRKGYQFTARKYPTLVTLIDGTGTVDEVHQKIWKNFVKLLI